MKRILSNNNEDYENNIDMTPMIDVVFILLIFFIVTASFVKESGIEIKRPEASTAKLVKSQNIFISITSENEIWFEKRKIDYISVQSLLSRAHASNGNGALIIQADQDSNAKTFAFVTDAARSVGIKEISLATSK